MRRCARPPNRRPSGDSLRLAVLAALNIADELFRCQDAQQAGRGALAERTEALERLVDAALATLTPGGGLRSLSETEFPALRVMVRRLVWANV